MSELQKKKEAGVIRNAIKEEIAVSVTDNATFPLASIEKKLETLPPGQAATRIIPKAIPGETGKSFTSSKVITGNRMICEINPVATAFFCDSKAVK